MDFKLEEVNHNLLLRFLKISGKRIKVEIKKGDGNEEAAQKYITSLGQSKFNPY